MVWEGLLVTTNSRKGQKHTHTNLPSSQKRKVRQPENTHNHHRSEWEGCAPTDSRDTQVADKSQRVRLLFVSILDLTDPQTLPELAADFQLQLSVGSLLAPGSRLWTWLFRFVCFFNHGKSTQHTFCHLGHPQVCRSVRSGASRCCAVTAIIHLQSSALPN